MTLKLVMDRLCRSGTSRLAHVVLVAQPVPVGQAYWNRLCLSQWDKQAGCTKPVPLGLGQVKRDLSLCHGTSHIPTMEAFPCAMTQALYHDGACTCSTCTNLCHKVGLQGRGMLCVNGLDPPLPSRSVLPFISLIYIKQNLSNNKNQYLKVPS